MKLSPGRMRLLSAVLSNLTDRDVDKAFERAGIPGELKIEFLRVVYRITCSAKQCSRDQGKKSSKK